MQTKSYHRKLYQYIVEELGQRIVQNIYPAGQVMPTEDKLCRELGVSRGVLREANKVLAQKGLIQTRPRIGSQVLTRENWNLFDPDVIVWRLQVEDKTAFLKNVTEVRRLIESEAARQAAVRAHANEVDEIRESLSNMQTVLGNNDHYVYEEYLTIDIAFHAAIMKASHNELLSQIGFTMRAAVLKARENDTADIDIQRASLPFHAAITEAIVNKTPEAAFKASQAMFDHVWQTIIRRER